MHGNLGIFNENLGIQWQQILEAFRQICNNDLVKVASDRFARPISPKKAAFWREIPHMSGKSRLVKCQYLARKNLSLCMDVQSPQLPIYYL